MAVPSTTSITTTPARLPMPAGQDQQKQSNHAMAKEGQGSFSQSQAAGQAGVTHHRPHPTCCSPASAAACTAMAPPMECPTSTVGGPPCCPCGGGDGCCCAGCCACCTLLGASELPLPAWLPNMCCHRATTSAARVAAEKSAPSCVCVRPCARRSGANTRHLQVITNWSAFCKCMPGWSAFACGRHATSAAWQARESTASGAQHSVSLVFQPARYQCPGQACVATAVQAEHHWAAAAWEQWDEGEVSWAVPRQGVQGSNLGHIRLGCGSPGQGMRRCVGGRLSCVCSAPCWQTEQWHAGARQSRQQAQAVLLCHRSCMAP